MSAYNKCKEAGLSGLDELSELSNRPKRTLQDWYQTNPELFDVVVLGCAEKKRLKTVCSECGRSHEE